MFDLAIQNKTNCLIKISSLPQARRIGKTTVLNEISFTYQALGYNVLIWTPFNDEHVGCKLIREPRDMRGIRPCNNTICLIDEVEFYPESCRIRHSNFDVRERLQDCGIVMVGFYN